MPGAMVIHREATRQSFTAPARSFFLPGDRRRGEELAAAGAVENVYRWRDWLTFEIVGRSDDYYVDMEFGLLDDAGELGACCTCPRSAEVSWCKHIWAVLEFADTFRPALKMLAGRRLRALHPVMLDEEEVVQMMQESELIYSADDDSVVSGGTVILSEEDNQDDFPWQSALGRVQQLIARSAENETPSRSRGSRVAEFVMSIVAQRPGEPLRLELVHPRGDGSTLRRDSLTPREFGELEPASRQLVAMMEPLGQEDDPWSHHDPYWRFAYQGTSRFELPLEQYEAALERMCRLGHLSWTLSFSGNAEDCYPVAWDDGPEYRLAFCLDPSAEEAGAVDFSAVIRREGEPPVSMEEVVCAVHGGLVLLPERLARLRAADVTFVDAFRRDPYALALDREDLGRFLPALAELGSPAALEVAPELGIREATAVPQPRVVLRAEDRRAAAGGLQAEVEMHAKVDGRVVPLDAGSRWGWDPEGEQVVYRDSEAERERLAELAQLEVPFETLEEVEGWGPVRIALERDQLPRLTEALSARGWEVVADGRRLQAASEFNIQVTSQTDWFDLEGEIDFGGQMLMLPELLRAIRRRQNYVTLGDGTCGVLPEEWLERYAPLAEAADLDQEGSARFSRVQAMLLDGLLAEQENVQFDAAFTKLRKKLDSFTGVRPMKPTPGFRGELRGYQREALGWFRFLRELGWGGCLADDMGLGKTVQVLALLESRRTRRTAEGEARKGSLAVVPKSLVFNWISEAERFTPKLRVGNYTGPGRGELLDRIDRLDLLVTTYGTLRRDVLRLKEFDFDYVILDEAQAIKNAASQSAKASRLLRGDHRLALTGTPVENHLGELWSLFDFLNPGMLGHAESFRRLMQMSREVQQEGGEGASESVQWLQRGIRPFLLRRTKEEVLKDLPEKSEQVIPCEMTSKQAKAYADLREHYRLHLNKKIKQMGLRRAKVHVLEALLRLRQAACDPRLLDAKQAPGAKLERLEQHLAEVLSEGHKALVFSQFTSLLALVRERLDVLGWKYSYLDGKTRNRQECVQDFQSDEECKIFLISLKAGGHGLNLTAADYVFILDPWWNPAVEAQAIDRSHRIGQTRPVIAYRYICRDTVEDKIVQLQQTKRKLADAIMSAGEGMLSQLSADDLRMLLG